jgi:hypothetical protein
LCKGISYAAVAAHADKNGRRKLAALLVEHEPRSSKQVEFLFSGYFVELWRPNIVSPPPQVMLNLLAGFWWMFY